MDSMLAGASWEHLYSDPDAVLNPLCSYCAIPLFQCVHSMPQAPYAAAQMLYAEAQHFRQPLPDPVPTETDLAPLLAYVKTEPLMDENVWQINANETAVRSTTVQAHVEDIYTPGDRLDQTKSRRASHRRQAPCPGGYRCEHGRCGRVFDRACELNRHRKTHLDRSERPHKCDACQEAFLYPKDLVRHQRKHIDQRSAQATFFCRYPGCHDLNGFSRRDNLLRHQRKQHPSIAAA